MALTRARPIHGDAAFMDHIKSEIDEVLSAPRDVKKIARMCARCATSSIRKSHLPMIGISS